MIESASLLFVCYISLLYHSGILNGCSQSSSTNLLPVLVPFNLEVEIRNWCPTRSFLFKAKPKFYIKVELNCDVLMRVRMYKKYYLFLDFCPLIFQSEASNQSLIGIFVISTNSRDTNA